MSLLWSTQIKDMKDIYLVHRHRIASLPILRTVLFLISFSLLNVQMHVRVFVWALVCVCMWFSFDAVRMTNCLGCDTFDGNVMMGFDVQFLSSATTKYKMNETQKNKIGKKNVEITNVLFSSVLSYTTLVSAQSSSFNSISRLRRLGLVYGWTARPKCKKEDRRKRRKKNTYINVTEKNIRVLRKMFGIFGWVVVCREPFVTVPNWV